MRPIGSLLPHWLRRAWGISVHRWAISANTYGSQGEQSVRVGAEGTVLEILRLRSAELFVYSGRSRPDREAPGGGGGGGRRQRRRQRRRRRQHIVRENSGIAQQLGTVCRSLGILCKCKAEEAHHHADMCNSMKNIIWETMRNELLHNQSVFRLCCGRTAHFLAERISMANRRRPQSASSASPRASPKRYTP